MMGLYLCLFENGEDVDGVEVGRYADYNALRDYIVSELEREDAGSRFPTFVLHSDCDGEWSVADCEKLQEELKEIAAELKSRPTVPFSADWQDVVAKAIGLIPSNAFESFIDVDGEFLLDRLRELVEGALARRVPILFQ